MKHTMICLFLIMPFMPSLKIGKGGFGLEVTSAVWTIFLSNILILRTSIPLPIKTLLAVTESENL